MTFFFGNRRKKTGGKREKKPPPSPCIIVNEAGEKREGEKKPRKGKTRKRKKRVVGRTIVVDIFKKERGEPQGTHKKRQKNLPLLARSDNHVSHKSAPCSLTQRARRLPCMLKTSSYIFSPQVSPFPAYNLCPLLKTAIGGGSFRKREEKRKEEKGEGCDSTSDKAVWVSPKHWATIFSLSFTIRNSQFFLWKFVNSSW